MSSPFFFSSLFFALCNVIRIPESGKCLLGECEILGIQFKVSGISLTIRIRNTSSTDKKSRIQRMESGIHGLEFVVPENIRTRPPPHGGQRKSEGREGGGSKKEAISDGGGGLLPECLFLFFWFFVFFFSKGSDLD